MQSKQVLWQQPASKVIISDLIVVRPLRKSVEVLICFFLVARQLRLQYEFTQQIQCIGGSKLYIPCSIEPEMQFLSL